MTAVEAYLSQFYLWVGLQPHTWFTAFMLATIGDAALTVYALAHGGKERNPLMRRLMGIIGIPPALFVIKGLQAATLFAALQVRILWVPVLAMVFIGVCLWNIGQILMMRKH